MPSLAFVLAAAAAAGFVDAMVGGGGLIQLPALLTAYAREMPATLLGTNKLSSVLGTSSALARYARSVSIPWRMLLPAVLVAVPGALLGASLASVLPARAFRALVPLILTAVLLYVLRNRGLGTRHAPVALRGPRRAAALGAIGLVAAYDGFFGPGTGNFLMLLYVRVYGFDFLNAAASARVVNAATNLGA
ncbi:MAG: TSUP family transporter, partial [Gammaproteobacteria bacterium]|nr:TSUP family transporter [Gammaproteobacteria bacterium]